MADYIDRQAAIAALREFAEDCMAILELVEAKEREQVRHGRWIRQQSGFGYSVWKCSICGRVLLPQTSPLLSNMEHLNDLYPYCHCGAKMDGGAEENG